MTPEELQRILRTEADHQKTIEDVCSGRGLPALTFLIVVVLVIYLYLYGVP